MSTLPIHQVSYSDPEHLTRSLSAAVFERAAIGIALLGFDGTLLETNGALQRFLGYSANELRGQMLHHFAPSEDVGHYARPVTDLTTGTCSNITVEQRYVRKDGQITWASVTMSRADGEHGGLIGIIAMVQDITTRKSLEAKLTHQAFHDPLTNLANRTLFRQRVEHALLRAHQREHVVVMFLDLDNFKTVNDSLGHSVGDDLLVIISGRLLNCTRGSDTVARLGGDEFAILLENVRDLAETRIVADRIARAMRDPIIIHDENVVIGVSIGIARPQDESDGADELLRNADVAMYTAKAKGKGHYIFFEHEMYAAVVDRLEMEADLRQAISEGQFTIFYQPLVHLESGHAVGVEALVRWVHPRRGILPPEDFIPIAEETGLILPLGRWVLREACRQAGEWFHRMPEMRKLYLTVNVSGKQLQDPLFMDEVRRALTDAELPPDRLMLEITETVIMHRTETMLQRLSEFKELGVRLAIDDFGTGYSSLSYLQQFPIDVLKIDRAFIEAISRDGASAALTRTIIGLGGTLGLSTVAEGIEHAQQRTVLKELGCEVGQGFLFARPLTPSETEAALRTIEAQAAP